MLEEPCHNNKIINDEHFSIHSLNWCHAAPRYCSKQLDIPAEVSAGKEWILCPKIKGEVLMTQIAIRSTEQGSNFNEYVAGALTALVVALSAVMFFSQFMA
jgi:hypothetical protein